jgi:DNA-binding transcriptional MerR regulator
MIEDKTKNDNRNDVENAILSIGGLAVASGIPVETLRNWERRYGFPNPIRLDSGHRRYPSLLIPRLRQIRRALDLGYRPSSVVMASAEELADLVGKIHPRQSSAEDARIASKPDSEIEAWLESVARMDSRRLEMQLHQAWLNYGARQTIGRIMVPFLRHVGEQWFNGRYTVAHEHVASETLQIFLAGCWRPLSSHARGGPVVLANFEGELHCLGLHMAAVLLSLHDIQVIFLGPNTPLGDIAAVGTQPGVRAVVIGLAASSDVELSARRLLDLKSRLPSGAVAAFGGNERLPKLPGVLFFDSLEIFEVWVADFKALW